MLGHNKGMLVSKAAAVAVALSCLAWARAASADDWGYAPVVGVLLPVAGNISAAGTHITLAQGNPSAEWGRTSMILAIPNGVLGGILLIVAGASDDSDAALFAISGVYLGTAIHGLIAGVINEAALPTPDPGIPGRERPSDQAATMFQLGGRF
jgi:hypothetical protein